MAAKKQTCLKVCQQPNASATATPATDFRGLEPCTHQGGEVWQNYADGDFPEEIPAYLRHAASACSVW